MNKFFNLLPTIVFTIFIVVGINVLYQYIVLFEQAMRGLK